MDLAGIQRTLWAVEIHERPAGQPDLLLGALTGGLASYPTCQAEAKRLRAAGEPGLVAPSAALRHGGARGWRVQAGLQPGGERDGKTVVLFVERPEAAGWRAAVDGRPDAALLPRVRHW